MDMKKLVFCIAVLISSQLFAQSNLTLFTEEGEKFTLFLNGVIQNKAFQTNVHVENINANTQKLRIVFEDKSIPSISENIYYETYNDYTYVIRKKKNVASKVKKIDGKAAINAYVLRLQDVKPLDRISISEKVDVVQSIDVETNEVKPIENITTNVTTTTTKTSNTAQTNSGITAADKPPTVNIRSTFLPLFIAAAMPPKILIGAIKINATIANCADLPAAGPKISETGCSYCNEMPRSPVTTPPIQRPYCTTSGLSKPFSLFQIS